MKRIFLVMGTLFLPIDCLAMMFQNQQEEDLELLCEWDGCNTRDVFANKEKLLKHYIKKHRCELKGNNDCQTFICLWHEGNGVCEKVLKNRSFHDHLCGHIGLYRYECPICHHKIIQKTNLNFHMWAKHEIDAVTERHTIKKNPTTIKTPTTTIKSPVRDSVVSDENVPFDQWLFNDEWISDSSLDASTNEEWNAFLDSLQNNAELFALTNPTG